MEWGLLLGSALSSLAGLTLALVTALLTDHRERRRWLETKVYQPLYGELTNVVSGELPGEDGDYSSLWADLEYYKTYRVDADLAEALDRYASDLSELAGHERPEDLDAFVGALPPTVAADGDPVAELRSGRTVDLRTWFRRNAPVLATDPAFRETGHGFEPAALDFLWDEVDGLTAADVDEGRVDTAAVLYRVSVEFNWGYETFYAEWDDGWADAMVAALRDAAAAPESAVPELLARRQAVGATAAEIKSLIETRSERGLYRSLWHEWRSD